MRGWLTVALSITALALPGLASADLTVSGPSALHARGATSIAIRPPVSATSLLVFVPRGFGASIDASAGTRVGSGSATLQTGGSAAEASGDLTVAGEDAACGSNGHATVWRLALGEGGELLVAVDAVDQPDPAAAYASYRLEVCPPTDALIAALELRLDDVFTTPDTAGGYAWRAVATPSGSAPGVESRSTQYLPVRITLQGAFDRVSGRATLSGILTAAGSSVAGARSQVPRRALRRIARCCGLDDDGIAGTLSAASRPRANDRVRGLRRRAGAGRSGRVPGAHCSGRVHVCNHRRGDRYEQASDGSGPSAANVAPREPGRRCPAAACRPRPAALSAAWVRRRDVRRAHLARGGRLPGLARARTDRHRRPADVASARSSPHPRAVGPSATCSPHRHGTPGAPSRRGRAHGSRDPRLDGRVRANPERALLRLPQGSPLLVGGVQHLDAVRELLRRRFRDACIPERALVSGVARLRARAADRSTGRLSLRGLRDAGLGSLMRWS